MDDGGYAKRKKIEEQLEQREREKEFIDQCRVIDGGKKLFSKYFFLLSSLPLFSLPIRSTILRMNEFHLDYAYQNSGDMCLGV